MGKTKRPRTPAQLANDQLMREAHQNKNPQTKEPTQINQDKSEGGTLTQDQYAELMQRLEAVENTPNQTVDQHLEEKQTVSVNQHGQSVGIITKFPIEARLYPDPRDELYDLPELRRFSPRDNVKFTWTVKGQVYETKFGTNVQEPFFTLDVHRLDYDEEGNLKPQAFRIGRLIFNEDETEALQIAQDMKFNLNISDMREIMNVARVERIKRWLLPYFQGHKIPPLQDNSSEQVDPQTGRAMQMTNTAELL